MTQPAYRKATDIVSRKIAEEFILVPIRRRKDDLDSIYSLNEVGGRIWELLDGTTTMDQIADAIANEFDVPAGTARADVLEFVADLESAGCLLKG